MPIHIHYSKSFVAYLDVLGFKNLVKSNNITALNNYFNIINDELDQLRRIKEKEDIGSIIISDSVILTVPQNVDDKIDNIFRLRQLCIAIGKIQQRLALDNIWIRGAISCGNTFFDSTNNQIVGPAYIDAFLLEEEFAIFPRVIIDSKIIKEIGYESADRLIYDINRVPEGTTQNDWGDKVLFNWHEGNVSAKTSIPQDVPFFIDYIYPLILRKDYDAIQKIINNIKLNIYEDIKVYPKHRWLTNYIKEIASKYHEGSELIDELYNQLLIL